MKKIVFDRIFNCFVFFSFSIMLCAFLNPDPFHPIFRACLYGLVPIYGILLLLYWYRKKQIKLLTNIYIYIYALLIYALFLFLALLVHHEFIDYGFIYLSTILFILIGLYEREAVEIKKEIDFIAAFFVYFTLAYSIISLFVDMSFSLRPDLLQNLDTHGISFFNSKVSNFMQGKRLKGFGRHPNVTGLVCAFGIICSVYNGIFNKTRTLRCFSYVSISVNSIAILICSARSSMLLFAISCFMILALSIALGVFKNGEYRRNLIILLCFLILFALLLAAAFFLLFDSPIDVLFDVVLRTDTIKGATGRSTLQKIAIKATTSRNPILGIGYHNLYKVLDGYGAHNLYIQIYATAGIICVMAYITMCAYSIYSAIKLFIVHKKLSEEANICNIFAFAMIVGNLLENCYESTLFLYFSGRSLFFYMLFTVPIVIWNNYKKANEVK